jgi:hypothetical protein
MATGLTFQQLQALVRNLCFEGVADEGLFKGDLAGFINAAYQSLYTEVVETSPSFFEVASAAQQLGAAGLAFGGTALDANGIHLVSGLEIQDPVGNWLPLDPVDRREIGMRAGPAASVSGSGWSFAGWYTQNFTALLYPSPATTQTARLLYVPEVAELSAGTDMPFAGNLRGFHRLIGYAAALLALDKDQVPLTLRTSATAMRGQLLRHVRRTQAQKSRRILRTDSDEF